MGASNSDCCGRGETPSDAKGEGEAPAARRSPSSSSSSSSSADGRRKGGKGGSGRRTRSHHGSSSSSTLVAPTEEATSTPQRSPRGKKKAAAEADTESNPADETPPDSARRAQLAEQANLLRERSLAMKLKEVEMKKLEEMEAQSQRELRARLRQEEVAAARAAATTAKKRTARSPMAAQTRDLEFNMPEPEPSATVDSDSSDDEKQAEDARAMTAEARAAYNMVVERRKAAAQALQLQFRLLADQRKATAEAHIKEDRNHDNKFDLAECETLVLEDLQAHCDATVAAALARRLPRFETRAEQRRMWGPRKRTPSEIEAKDEKANQRLEEWRAQTIAAARRWVTNAKATAAQLYKLIDTSGDGFIDYREFSRSYPALFARVLEADQNLEILNLAGCGKLSYQPRGDEDDEEEEDEEEEEEEEKKAE